MKKSTKSVLAAGAAVVVLTGGAGSLAYWNAEADVDGGTVDAGELAIEADGAGTWELNGNPVPTGDPQVVIVPGDVLTYTGDYLITAVGDNIEADVTADGDAAGDLADYVDTSAVALDSDGQALATITEANDGDTVTVELTVDFPFDESTDNTADNASQTLQLDLSGFSVVLTQTDATP